MQISLTPTAEVTMLRRGDRSMPTRIWSGQTDTGVPVKAWVATVQPQTDDPEAEAAFDAALDEIDRSEVDRRFPCYRLIGGDICRQDTAGGRWTPLASADANALLARLNGAEPPAEATRGIDMRFIL